MVCMCMCMCMVIVWSHSIRSNFFGFCSIAMGLTSFLWVSFCCLLFKMVSYTSMKCTNITVHTVQFLLCVMPVMYYYWFWMRYVMLFASRSPLCNIEHILYSRTIFPCPFHRFDCTLVHFWRSTSKYYDDCGSTSNNTNGSRRKIYDECKNL